MLLIILQKIASQKSFGTAQLFIVKYAILLKLLNLVIQLEENYFSFQKSGLRYQSAPYLFKVSGFFVMIRDHN